MWWEPNPKMEIAFLLACGAILGVLVSVLWSPFWRLVGWLAEVLT